MSQTLLSGIVALAGLDLHDSNDGKKSEIEDLVKTVPRTTVIRWVMKTFFHFCAVTLHDYLVLLSSGSVLMFRTSKSDSSENTFVIITLCFLAN